MKKSAVIVIPSTGSLSLQHAIQSAVNQDYTNVETWVIIDGPEYSGCVQNLSAIYPQVKFCVLPSNTGRNGFYGHRIYSAVSFLFNHDYILYLDQDNSYDPDHVSTMISTCESNKLDWCHSLRKIYDKDNNYICHDNCESLGQYPIFGTVDQHLVDTSTYCIKKEVIVQIGSAWYSGWGGDRRFYSIISKYFPKFECTGKYTVNYKLDGNPNSVTADFFIHGNNIMNTKFSGQFPWKK